MTGTLASDLLVALDQFAQLPQVLVASDFDGVLAPLVLVPESARPLPEASAALQILDRQPGVQVALISGRTLTALNRYASPPPGAWLVGSHGAEFARSGEPALPLVLTPAQAELHAAMAAELRAISLAFPGTAVEIKPAGAVLHTRQASREDAEAASAKALAGPAVWPGVQLTLGKEVVDLAVLDATKGGALRRLRADLGLPAAAGGVLYLGDDVTDERAFEVLDDDTGDITIKVGEGTTVARHRVPDPPLAAAVLSRLAQLRTPA